MADRPISPRAAPADRYSAQPLPATRYVPGHTQRPERSVQTSRIQTSDDRHLAISDTWSRNGSYLYGVDLYNFGYWWECHETFEELWHVAGRKTPPARFLQALIQIAAGNLKRLVGAHNAAQNLWGRGVAGLEAFEPFYMGIDIQPFARDVRAYAENRREIPAVIRLEGLEGSPRS
jgi:predicted metal-dependent hydrolase